MTKRDALLQAVLDHPTDYDYRLVFADYLDEHPRHEYDELWAARIRDMISNKSLLHRNLSDAIALCGQCSEDGNELSWSKKAMPKDVGATIRGGFIEAINCKKQKWLEYSQYVLGNQPIVKYNVTDLECGHSTFFPGEYFIRGMRSEPPFSRHDFPLAYLFLVKKHTTHLGMITGARCYFKSSEEGITAFEEAALEYAREQYKNSLQKK